MVAISQLVDDLPLIEGMRQIFWDFGITILMN